jgi:hypothetical protein
MPLGAALAVLVTGGVGSWRTRRRCGSEEQASMVREA